jgi:hypothetical protein
MTPSSYRVANDTITERHNGMLWGNQTIGDLLDLYGPHRDVIVDMSNRDDTEIEKMALNTPIAYVNLGFFKKWRFLDKHILPIRRKISDGTPLTDDDMMIIKMYLQMHNKTCDMFSMRKYRLSTTI